MRGGGGKGGALARGGDGGLTLRRPGVAHC